MKLRDIVKILSLEIKCGKDKLDTEVKGGYVSDLLSDCLAHAKEGDIWVTLQIHPNIVAVAILKNLCGIIIINGREPEEETLKKAIEEALPIFVSELPAFEVVGRLYTLGVSGMR